MSTRVQLLVSEWCAPCRGAEEVWRQAAQRKDFVFEVLDVGQPEGRAIVARLGVKTVPAGVVDGRLCHVGVPSLAQALEFVAAAPARSAGRAGYVGLTLAPTARWAIAAAALYLAIAGSALLLGGGIVADPPWRQVGAHVFGIGFIGFAVFGFGEHMLPRFTGAPIRGGRFAWAQQALAHAGLAGLAAGFALGIVPLALSGGLLAWLGLLAFALRLLPAITAGGR